MILQFIPRPPDNSSSSSPLSLVARGLAPVLLLERGLLGLPQLLHDLVLEMLLVLQDVALPLGHSLLFADPYLVRNLQQG